MSINGAVKQRSDLSHHIWTVPETVRAPRVACRYAALTPLDTAAPKQISYLSRLVALAPGDLLFMGTPEGVGPVVRGDVLEAAIDGCVSLLAWMLCCDEADKCCLRSVASLKLKFADK